MSLAPGKKRKVAFENDVPDGETIKPEQMVKKKRFKQHMERSTVDKKKQESDGSVINSPSPHSTFKVIAGSYEKLLYGLKGNFDIGTGKATLEPIFIFPAHLSCIKSVAASPNGGKWLATGSADEVIKVWDLRKRKEVGGLIQHEGALGIFVKIIEFDIKNLQGQ